MDRTCCKLMIMIYCVVIVYVFLFFFFACHLARLCESLALSIYVKFCSKVEPLTKISAPYVDHS
jgi:hypothetical protein